MKKPVIIIAAILGVFILLAVAHAHAAATGWHTIVCQNKWTGDQFEDSIGPGMANRCPSFSYQVP